jgi:hypothetical protein
MKTLLRKSRKVQSYCTHSKFFRWHCGSIDRSAILVTRRDKIAPYELSTLLSVAESKKVGSYKT